MHASRGVPGYRVVVVVVVGRDDYQNETGSKEWERKENGTAFGEGGGK